jgi:hypothetical protein
LTVILSPELHQEERLDHSISLIANEKNPLLSRKVFPLERTNPTCLLPAKLYRKMFFVCAPCAMLLFEKASPERTGRALTGIGRLASSGVDNNSLNEHFLKLLYPLQNLT